MTYVDKGRGQCEAATTQGTLSALLGTDGSWEGQKRGPTQDLKRTITRSTRQCTFLCVIMFGLW